MAKLIIVLFALVALQQLVACAELGDKNKLEQAKPEVAEDKNLAIPILILNKSAPGQRAAKADYFLIWMKPWEQYIPEQVQDMINSQVRPQTEQISGQISQIPGAEQWYEMVSQLQGTLSGMMPGGSGGSNPLAGLMGRRR